MKLPIAPQQLATNMRGSTPQQNTYKGNLAMGGRITTQFEGGPAVVSALGGGGGAGEGLGALARGFGAWADVLERQEAQKQNLDAMAKAQTFQDKLRDRMDQMSQLEGEQGFDAPKYMEDFLLKEGRALVGQAKGDVQRNYFENVLARSRDSSLDKAFAHRAVELDRYEQSVTQTQMANLYTELDENPAAWQTIEEAGIGYIKAARPGLETAHEEQAFKEVLAQKGVEAAMAQGDRSTAEAIVNALGTSKNKADLRAAIAQAESKAKVDAMTREGMKAYQDNQPVEFRERQMQRFLGGEITADELEDSLKTVATLEENDRKARAARAEQLETQAREEWLQNGINTAEDVEAFKKDTRLPADYRERTSKELRAPKTPSLNSVKGRDIDLRMTMAAMGGDWLPGDRNQITEAANKLDPTGEYISRADIDRYAEVAEKYASSALKDVFDAIGAEKRFKGDKGGAVDFYRFRQNSIRRLRSEGFDPTSRDAADKVLEWKDQKIDVNGEAPLLLKPFMPWTWGGKEPWFNTDESLWLNGPATNSVYQDSGVDPGAVLSGTSFEQPRSTGGVGGVLGSSMASAGVLARTALDMAGQGESHWLTDFEENETSAAFAQLIDDQIQAQGLPATVFTREWVGRSLLENTPAREITPAFAQAWPGQGRVSLNNLGKVHDYNGLIERYALSNGIDPNLIAAMMYAESGGNRFAVSSAGAAGLMQFMPATAKRFGITDRSDPAQSIRGACEYMRILLDRFDGNPVKAVAAYNAGEGNIDKGRYPAETRKYVSKIFGIWQSAGGGAGGIGGDAGQITGNLNTQPGRGGFVAPLANMLVTSKYGPRNTGIAGTSRNHFGLDLRAPIGTPVGTVADGVVETAMYKGKNGNYVVIDHGGGRKSYYLHLDGFSRGLKPGMKVTAGQIIGRSGNSGSFKKPLAPHLDFRISENGQFVDPTKYFANLQYKKGA